VNLIDLGMAEEPKDIRSRVLAGTNSVMCPVKMEQNGIGQSRGPSQHKVRGSPIPADETSDEDADELPPTGRRRSIGKSHRASKRRHHKLEGETNGASDGLKVKIKDKHRRDDSPGSSSRAHVPVQVIGNGTTDGVRDGILMGSRLIHQTKEVDVTESKTGRHLAEAMTRSRTRMMGRNLTRRTNLQPRMGTTQRNRVQQGLVNQSMSVLTLRTVSSASLQVM